jgi:CelD/BcsL family acetyltransferase involved in cellulose biosynthesis
MGVSLTSFGRAVLPLAPPAAVPAAGQGFTAEIARDWAEIRARWRDAVRRSAPTPFQTAQWFDAWFATLGREPGVEPVLASLSDRASGELAALLPLVRVRRHGIDVIEFADLGLTDYNLPVLGPAAPRDSAGAAALFRTLRRSLPGADLLRLVKMPATVGDAPNPLSLLGAAQPCSLNGNLVPIPGSFEEYRRGTLSRHVRMDLERSWRIFSRRPGTAFRVVTEPAEARRVLAVMTEQQKARLEAMGQAFELDRPVNAAFYERLATRGLAENFAVVTVLSAGEEIVAGLLAIRDERNFVILRISNAGGEWSNCSPGRLVVERTMAAFHEAGYRVFDFSIGNYAYKRRFGTVAVPLLDVTSALSWRGLPQSLKAQATHRIRRHPRLDRLLRDLAGQTRPREE